MRRPERHAAPPVGHVPQEQHRLGDPVLFGIYGEQRRRERAFDRGDNGFIARPYVPRIPALKDVGNAAHMRRKAGYKAQVRKHKSGVAQRIVKKAVARKRGR